MFESYIGIDYSGKGSPLHKHTSIQVVEANQNSDPLQLQNSLSRKEVFNYLDNCFGKQKSGEIGNMIIGIDHGLSFPISYFVQHSNPQSKLHSWDDFLRFYCSYWNYTKSAPISSQTPSISSYLNPLELRLTEKFSSSAKSVLNLNPNTISVAFSTHAGLPWIYDLRMKYKDILHFWPFDGFDPKENMSVIAEVYPSIFYNRYKQIFPKTLVKRDAQDAYSISAWLKEQDQKGKLATYLSLVTLDEDYDKLIASLEGWILGIL